MAKIIARRQATITERFATSPLSAASIPVVNEMNVISPPTGLWFPEILSLWISTPLQTRWCSKHRLKIQVFSAQVIPIHRASALFVRFVSFVSAKVRVECVVWVDPIHECIRSKISLNADRHEFSLRCNRHLQRDERMIQTPSEKGVKTPENDGD